MDGARTNQESGRAHLIAVGKLLTNALLAVTVSRFPGTVQSADFCPFLVQNAVKSALSKSMGWGPAFLEGHWLPCEVPPSA